MQRIQINGLTREREEKGLLKLCLQIKILLFSKGLTLHGSLYGAHRNLCRCYNAKSQAVWRQLLLDLLLGECQSLLVEHTSESHWSVSTCSYAQMCIELLMKSLVSFLQLQRFLPSAKGFICLDTGINQNMI